MPYIPPQDVKSPKARWHLFEVILDQGPYHGAYALGEWDGDRCLVFRWNGSDESPLGNPQSRGLPVWVVLEEPLYKAVIALLKLDKQETARRFLGITD